MRLAFAFLALVSTINVYVIDASDGCLTVKLHDAFGDGWGRALWYYETPSGETGHSAPNCTAKHVTKKVCGSADGFYYFVVQASEGEEVPENVWEIRWEVKVDKTGEVFTGGYNTSVVFDYDKDAGDFRIVYWQNMWSNTLNFTGCGASSPIYDGTCVPSPSSETNAKFTDHGSLKHGRVKATAAPVGSMIIGGGRNRAHKGIKRRLATNEDEFFQFAHKGKTTYTESSSSGSSSDSMYSTNSSDESSSSSESRYGSGSRQKKSKVVVSDRATVSTPIQETGKGGNGNEGNYSISADAYSSGNNSTESSDANESGVDSVHLDAHTRSPRTIVGLFKGIITAKASSSDKSESSTGGHDSSTNSTEQVEEYSQTNTTESTSEEGGSGSSEVSTTHIRVHTRSPRNGNSGGLFKGLTNKRYTASSEGGSDNSGESAEHVSDNNSTSTYETSTIDVYNTTESTSEEGSESESHENNQKHVHTRSPRNGNSGGLFKGLTNKRDSSKAEGDSGGSSGNDNSTETYMTYSYSNTSDSDNGGDGGSGSSTASGSSSHRHIHTKSPRSIINSAIFKTASSKSDNGESDEEDSSTNFTAILNVVESYMNETEGQDSSSAQGGSDQTHHHHTRAPRNRNGDSGGLFKGLYQKRDDAISGGSSSVGGYENVTSMESTDSDHMTAYPSSVSTLHPTILNVTGGSTGGAESSPTVDVGKSTISRIGRGSRQRNHNGFRGTENHESDRASASGSGQNESDYSNYPTLQPVHAPTVLPTNSSGGSSSGETEDSGSRVNGNSGGLLKGNLLKRTVKKIRNNRSSPTDAPSMTIEETHETMTISNPSYNITAPNMTVVHFNESSYAMNHTQSHEGSGEVSVSSSVKKSLGRNKHMHSAVAKGYPTSLLKVTMFESNGQGWFKPNYEGLAFYISDESKTELLAYGTLENGSYSGFCQFCFDDGSYYFRVTTPGDHNTDAQWSFCNTKGEYGQQLAFHIEDGTCVPDALIDVNAICEGTYSTVVTVKGQLSLSGVVSEVFDSGSAWVVSNAIAESVSGWDSAEVYISDTNLNIRTDTRGRALSSFTFDINFEASFVSEMAYEIDGTSYFGVVGLVEELKIELADIVYSGSFTNTVRALAFSSGVVALDDVHEAKLVDLQIEDITYVGTKDLSISEEVAAVESFSTVSLLTGNVYESSQFVPFVSMVALGFVSFIGVLIVSVRLRRPSSSTHDLVVEDSSHAGVDMTSHISNHLSPSEMANREAARSLL
eukprot:gene6003-12102_t